MWLMTGILVITSFVQFIHRDLVKLKESDKGVYLYDYEIFIHMYADGIVL